MENIYGILKVLWLDAEGQHQVSLLSGTSPWSMSYKQNFKQGSEEAVLKDGIEWRLRASDFQILCQ